MHEMLYTNTLLAQDTFCTKYALHEIFCSRILTGCLTSTAAASERESRVIAGLGIAIVTGAECIVLAVV